MSKPLSQGLGILLVLFGGLFTLQGVGVVGGSAMTGSTFWAIAGPIILIVGLALIWSGTRSRRPR